MKKYLKKMRDKMLSPVLASLDDISISIDNLRSPASHASNEALPSSAPDSLKLNHMTGIDRERKIMCNTVRISELELFAYEINEKGIEGNVAELGVYQGDFARFINTLFPNKMFYLFDTFEGFHDNDIGIETANNYSGAENVKNVYAVPTVDVIMQKMIAPERCIIKKGWFPSTTEGIDDKFCFVHLDADLFAPIYAGLCYFYPKMNPGGYILIHDYNNEKYYKGPKQAVRQFCIENKLSYTPLCDTQGSVVIAI